MPWVVVHSFRSFTQTNKHMPPWSSPGPHLVLVTVPYLLETVWSHVRSNWKQSRFVEATFITYFSLCCVFKFPIIYQGTVFEAYIRSLSCRRRAFSCIFFCVLFFFTCIINNNNPLSYFKEIKVKVVNIYFLWFWLIYVSAFSTYGRTQFFISNYVLAHSFLYLMG